GVDQQVKGDGQAGGITGVGVRPADVLLRGRLVGHQPLGDDLVVLGTGHGVTIDDDGLGDGGVGDADAGDAGGVLLHVVHDVGLTLLDALTGNGGLGGGDAIQGSAAVVAVGEDVDGAL